MIALKDDASQLLEVFSLVGLIGFELSECHEMLIRSGSKQVAMAMHKLQKQVVLAREVAVDLHNCEYKWLCPYTQQLCLPELHTRQGCTGLLHMRQQRCTGLHRAAQGCTGLRRAAQGCTGLHMRQATGLINYAFRSVGLSGHVHEAALGCGQPRSRGMSMCVRSVTNTVTKFDPRIGHLRLS